MLARGFNLRRQLARGFWPPGGTYQHTLSVYKPPWQPSIFAELNLRFPVAQKALFTEFWSYRMIFLTGRRWSIRVGWQRCLSACLAGAILFVSGCAKVAVPDVEGQAQDAAATAIVGAKLKVGTITQQTNNTVATGRVISQDPASGSSVSEGSLVNLVISSGPQMVAVPKVEELTQDAASTAITTAKLKVGTITQQTSNTVATGKVISQSPASGSSMAEGSPVNLVISSGPEMVVVPNVEGLTQAAATTAITAAKLTMGTVTQQTSNTVATGKVISQDPASGGSVAQGSLVNLVISSE